MKTSPQGVALIQGFEGFRQQVYLDAVGLPTIGYGHLLKSGEAFPDGVDTITAVALLESDLAVAERAVTLHAPQANQNQFDALVSFAFNLGAQALVTMLSHGFDQVPMQILRWNHAGGRVLTGLTARREAECALFCAS